MFYSHSFLSRKGPLGAIWVAAYCFKQLKKAQVTQTDISSSIDKILQDEFDAVTYRVLAYLLLGVVRIFSKKVEYLFDDCNKVLFKIKDFVVSAKERTLAQTLRAPYFSITLPERFELDAFDLEILEDTSGGNVMPYEAITLKDAMWKAGAIMPYSLEKYHFPELAVDQDIISRNYIPNDGLSSHLVDFDMAVGKSHNLSSSQSSTEKLQENRFTQCESTELEILPTVEEGPLVPAQSLDEDHQQKAMVDSDEMCAERSMHEVWENSIFQEAGLNLQIFDKLDEESDNIAKSFGKHHQTDGEQIKVSDSIQETQAVIEEHCDINTLGASMEKVREDAVAQEESMDVEMFCRIKELPEQIRSSDEKYLGNLEQNIILEVDESLENTRPFAEEQQSNTEHQTSLEITPPRNRKYQESTEDHPLSLTLDKTPCSKFPDASGITTLEISAIATPACKEGGRVPRKRKCIFDDMIVFPNNVFKQFIEDSSDLIIKRRKVPHTALAAWRASQVSHLPQCFLESLIPCASLDLRSLLSGKKLKVSVSLDTGTVAQTFTFERPAVGTVESSEKLDKSKFCFDGQPAKTNSLPKLNVSASPAVDRLEESIELAEKCDIQVSPTAAGRSSEQAPIAPETPILRTKSLRTIESPEGPGISNSDVVRLESEREEKEPSASKEHDFDLSMMDEEIIWSDGDNENEYGWSERTRLAVRCLRRTFLNQKKRREEEVANLLPLLEGRTRKESARLFYEILVLKSKGYVDLKQENAYGDVLIRKAYQWGQAFGEEESDEVSDFHAFGLLNH